MNSPENNKWLDKILGETIGSEKIKPNFKQWKEQHPQAVEQLISQAHQDTPSTGRWLSIRRTIMKNHISRYAAAAIIIVSTIIGLYWFGTATPAYGINDALEIWRNAETIHIKGWEYHHTGDDTYLEKFPFEQWYDLKNGRYRTWDPWDWFGDYTTETPRYGLEVSDGQYIMRTTFFIRSDDNKIFPWVYYEKLSPFLQRLSIHTMEVFPEYIGNLDQVKGFTKIGQENIKNKTVDVWEGEITAVGDTIPYAKMKIWMSPENGEIVRIFYWVNAEEDSVRWIASSDADTIEYNVTPPEDCFSLESPEGYEPQNTKETANEIEFGKEEGIKNTECMGFTLVDGSVIYGWHANDKPEKSQAHLFENLEPAGPLPVLPAQVIKLEPWPVEEDITLTGYHLTYTQKKGRYYEWGIYIPDKTMPKRETFNAYKITQIFNDTEPRSLGGRLLNIGNELIINTEEEFDTWVLGAMAELSDDGKAPDLINYEYVLQLAEQIRNSQIK